MRITTPIFLGISLVASFLSTPAMANIVTVEPGEILRLTFTAPFPPNCINPVSFPGLPPAPCNALQVDQDSANRVTPVGVLVTGSRFDGPNLLGTQTTTGCDERGPSGACNGFLFLFPVLPSGIVNGILDLTFGAPVEVDLSATRFSLTGVVVTAGGGRLAGVFPPILSATVVPLAKDHFLCYKVKEHRKFEKRDVLIRNQFGEQTFTVLEPDTLCVPSTKEEIHRK